MWRFSKKWKLNYRYYQCLGKHHYGVWLWNIPHRLTILNSCSPVVALFGEFMEPLLDGAFVEEVCHCKLSKFKRTPPLINQSFPQDSEHEFAGYPLSRPRILHSSSFLGLETVPIYHWLWLAHLEGILSLTAAHHYQVDLSLRVFLLQ